MKKLGRVLSTIATLTFFLMGCSPDTKDDRKDIHVNSLEDVLNNLAPATNTFEINSEEETVLTGDEGTVIYIPENAFQFADGSAPKGKVHVELKECYSITDMIAENLQTTSGNRILETAGMIYLKATADSKPLSLVQGSAFVVGFPKNGATEDMDLFYDFAFSDSLSTWVPDYKMYEAEAMQEALADTTKSEGDEALTINYPVEMTDDLYDYGFSASGYTATFFDLLVSGQNRIVLDYINDPQTVDENIAREFHENHWRISFDFNIDETGQMNNFRPERGGLSNYNERAKNLALDYLKSIPPFDLTSYEREVKHDWDYSLGIMGGRSINWDRFKSKFREQYSEYTDRAVQSIDRGALDYYIMSATKMGWINCDRFLDLEEESKIDFVVKTKSPKDTKIQVIFKDINSIMNGIYQDGHLVFKNVPLNQEVKVIGISYANGNPTMSVAETIIDTNGFELTAYNEFSLDQLETELNKMN